MIDTVAQPPVVSVSTHNGTSGLNFASYGNLAPRNTTAETLSGAMAGAVTGGMIGLVPMLMMADKTIDAVSKESRITGLNGTSLAILGVTTAVGAVMGGWIASLKTDTHNRWASSVQPRPVGGAGREFFAAALKRPAMPIRQLASTHIKQDVKTLLSPREESLLKTVALSGFLGGVLGTTALMEIDVCHPKSVTGKTGLITIGGGVALGAIAGTAAHYMAGRHSHAVSTAFDKTEATGFSR